MRRLGAPSEGLSDLAWAGAVTAWVLVALVRANALLATVHPYALLLVQVLPLAIATVLQLAPGVQRPDSGGRRVVLASTALGAFAVVSTVWSIDPARSAAQGMVLVLALAFLLSTLLLRWPARLAHDITVLWVVGAALTLAGVLGRLAGVDLTVGVAGRSQGFVANPNYFGMLLTTTIWAGLWLLAHSVAARGLRLVQTVSIGLALGALVTTGSRGSMLALLAGLAVLVVLDRGRLRTLGRTFALAMPVAALVVLTWTFAPPPQASVLVTPAETSGNGGSDGGSDGGSGGGSLGALVDRSEMDTDVTSGRLGIWKDALHDVADRPILGHGYRTSEVVLDGVTTHNLPLTLALELGVVGLVLVLMLLGSLATAARSRRSVDAVLAAAAVSLLVQELLESTLHAPSGPVALLQLLVLYAVAAPATGTRANEDPVTSRSAG